MAKRSPGGLGFGDDDLTFLQGPAKPKSDPFAPAPPSPPAQPIQREEEVVIDPVPAVVVASPIDTPEPMRPEVREPPIATPSLSESVSTREEGKSGRPGRPRTGRKPLLTAAVSADVYEFIDSQVRTSRRPNGQRYKTTGDYIEDVFRPIMSRFDLR
jgi:hypothetical protein